MSVQVLVRMISQTIAHNGELHGQNTEASPEEPQPTNGPDSIDSNVGIPDVNSKEANTETKTLESVADGGSGIFVYCTGCFSDSRQQS